MSAQGLTVSPGTLADSLKRFVPLFEPLAGAILAHQNKAAQKLFAEGLLDTVIVCDRYRSYEAGRETGATLPFLETS